MLLYSVSDVYVLVSVLAVRVRRVVRGRGPARLIPSSLVSQISSSGRHRCQRPLPRWLECASRRPSVRATRRRARAAWNCSDSARTNATRRRRRWGSLAAGPTPTSSRRTCTTSSSSCYSASMAARCAHAAQRASSSTPTASTAWTRTSRSCARKSARIGCRGASPSSDAARRSGQTWWWPSRTAWVGWTGTGSSTPNATSAAVSRPARWAVVARGYTWRPPVHSRRSRLRCESCRSRTASIWHRMIIRITTRIRGARCIGQLALTWQRSTRATDCGRVHRWRWHHHGPPCGQTRQTTIEVYTRR